MAGGGASSAAAADPAADADAIADATADRLGWASALQKAGEFLARAKAHFEAEIPGLEVQSVRVAAQESMCETFARLFGGEQAADEPLRFALASNSPVAAMAAALERLAKRHGVPMLSLGCVVDGYPCFRQLLGHVPAVIEATQDVSCSFEALERGEGDNAEAVEEVDCDLKEDPLMRDTYYSATPPGALLHDCAEVVVEIARRTGGRGNFRFGLAAGCDGDGERHSGFRRAGRDGWSQENRPTPFFPVAGGGTIDGRDSSERGATFAIGCESDTLLRAACVRVCAAAADAGSGEDDADDDENDGVAKAARNGRITAALTLALTDELHDAMTPLLRAAVDLQDSEGTVASKHGGRAKAKWAFLGLDSSLAPGLDTPSLTGSFELLLPLVQQRFNGGGGGRGLAALPPPRFGDHGTLALCSAVTRALQSHFWGDLVDEEGEYDEEKYEEPSCTTGYCGIMLAVLEDRGLARLAAEGRLKIPQLLSWSAVCGTGLDTVPVPGPRWRVAGGSSSAGVKKEEVGGGDRQVKSEAAGGSGAVKSEAAGGDGGRGSNKRVKREAGDNDDADADDAEVRDKDYDADLAARIAGVMYDVCAMALRLRKPLAVRLLPLPGLVAGDETRRALGGHPHLLDSRVMDL